MKTLKLLSVLVVLCMSALVAKCQTNYPNAEALAQADLRVNSDYYHEQFTSYHYVNGVYQSLNMDAYLNQQLWVTNLTVNGTNIPLPKPLSGLPIPSDGYANVNIDVVAMDKNGNQASHGSTNMNYLAQGTPVTVMMIPKFPETAIQLKSGLSTSQIKLVLDGVNGYGWSYDPTTGLLTIDVWDVASGSASFTATDAATGSLLAHGSMPFFQGPAGAPADPNAVLSMYNAGHTLKLPITSNGGNYAFGLQFDSPVIRGGTNLLAKVIEVPDVANQSGLYIYVSSSDPVQVEVRKWSANGTMQLIPVTIQDNEKGYLTLTAPAVDKAVITIVPTGTPSGNSFYVNVSRNYN